MTAAVLPSLRPGVRARCEATIERLIANIADGESLSVVRSLLFAFRDDLVGSAL